MRTKYSLFAAAMIGAAVPVHACIWDTETMAVEKVRFPEAQQIMTGYFPRHSAEFYQWRMEKCQNVIKQGGAGPAVYDDLAVSQHKLGDHRAAIATMMEKEKPLPGLYETFSNLGTFYIYTGEPEEALKWIDNALAQNPEAHFGREKYQRWLVMWSKAPRPTDEVIREMGDVGQRPHQKPVGFAKFLLEQQKVSGHPWPENERAAALKGVLGMMRFADFDNPLLQEALGDILVSGDWATNSMTNAAFAYRIAVSNARSGEEKQRLFAKFTAATSVIGENWTPKKVGTEVGLMLAKGKTLSAAVRRDEMNWIKAKKDVSEEFVRKYLTN